MSWQITAIAINVVLAAGFVFMEMRMMKRYKSKLELGNMVDATLTEGKTDET
jgi:beta-glucosidase